MCWSMAVVNLMGATVTQGTPVAFAAGTLAENTNFLRIHVLKAQLINPARTLPETTGSQRYTAK